MQSCFLFEKPINPKVDSDLPSFNKTPSIFTINSRNLQEASGIVSSNNFANKLWVQNDGGNPPYLHLISDAGDYIGNINLQVENRDWEDIAYGPGPIENSNYIYVADTGDNQEKEKEYSIYRVQEPNGLNSNLSVERIKFVYEDGKSYDTETLLCDPKTKDLYLITKRQLNVKVFKLKYPYSNSEINTAKFEGAIKVPFLVGGDISPDGSEIILKSLTTIYYWKKQSTESIFETLERDNDLILPYQRENQGEAVCFSKNANSYFTIGELSGNQNKLYRYDKLILD